MEPAEYRVMRTLEDDYWWFVGRRFLVRRLARNLLPAAGAAPPILDLGCGTGGVLADLAGFGRVFGIDVSAAALRESRRRGFSRLSRADLNGPLPFRDGAFSLVTCLDVLEHLEGDRRLMAEMVRVCRPGGHVVVTAPALPGLWSPHDRALHHRRRYTRAGLRAAVPRAGCRVVRDTYLNFLLLGPIAIYRRVRRRLPPGERPRSDFHVALPGWVNRILGGLFRAEIACLDRVRLPVGLSLLLVLRKGAAPVS